MGTVTYVSNDATLKADYTVSSEVAYPYPVVKYSTLVRAGDTLQQTLNRLSTYTIVDFENKPVEFAADFAQGQWYRSPTDSGGYAIYAPNLIGVLNADLRMTPMSSGMNNKAVPPRKIADIVNSLPNGAVNSYNAFRLGRGNPANTVPAYFTGKFTATDQGHLYHAIQLYQTDKGVIGPLVVKGMKGTQAAPPGEVFPLGTYRSTNLTFNDVEIDGKDAAGIPVSSGGIGNGNTPNTVYNYNRVNSHDIIHGGGITHYLLTNMEINFTDSKTSSNGWVDLNFEQCAGSRINIARHTFGGSPVDMVIDGNNGFATVTITDPKFSDGRVAGRDKVKICVHNKYAYPPVASPPANTQLDPATNNHITLIVNGVSRPDLIQFVTSYTPRG